MRAVLRRRPETTRLRGSYGDGDLGSGSIVVRRACKSRRMSLMRAAAMTGDATGCPDGELGSGSSEIKSALRSRTIPARRPAATIEGADERAASSVLSTSRIARRSFELGDGPPFAISKILHTKYQVATYRKLGAAEGRAAGKAPSRRRCCAGRRQPCRTGTRAWRCFARSWASRSPRSTAMSDHTVN
jgi:hypothetical protein